MHTERKGQSVELDRIYTLDESGEIQHEGQTEDAAKEAARTISGIFGKIQFWAAKIHSKGLHPCFSRRRCPTLTTASKFSTKEFAALPACPTHAVVPDKPSDRCPTIASRTLEWSLPVKWTKNTPTQTPHFCRSPW